MLQHAAAIATAFQKDMEVEILDHFILYGAQFGNRNILPSMTNSIPFGLAFNSTYFMEHINLLGMKADLFPLILLSKQNLVNESGLFWMLHPK